MIGNKKDMSIETLRGIALLLMVSGHIIGPFSYLGLKVDDNSFYRFFYDCLFYVRMPLFTAISGFVYAIRPVESNHFRFIGKKGRRLLLPLAFVGSLQWLTMRFAPGVNTPTEDLTAYWRIFLFSYNQFWFLHGLFLVFICLALIEWMGVMLYIDLFNR